jgi:hypothetical protein
MISKLVRKTRTLTETLHDFCREPLASFRGAAETEALQKGVRDRRQPVPPELVSRVLYAYQAAKRDQRSAEYQAAIANSYTSGSQHNPRAHIIRRRASVQCCQTTWRQRLGETQPGPLTRSQDRA